MTETTADQAEKEKAAFEEWMQCIDANTTVVPVPEAAALTPERREVLENVIGRDGLEAVLLALAPGHILWTDDGIFAEAAKTELGVERVWTQAVIEHVANLGLIDRAASNEAYAKLVGFNFHLRTLRGRPCSRQFGYRIDIQGRSEWRNLICRRFRLPFNPAPNRRAGWGDE